MKEEKSIDTEKSVMKGRKKLRGTQEQKTLYSSGFRGLQTKKNIRELEGRLENQRTAALPSIVRWFQGKTTHLSAFEHQRWLLHQSTKARKRLAKKSNFTPNVRYVTCSSRKKTTIVMAGIKKPYYPTPPPPYGTLQDSLFSWNICLDNYESFSAGAFYKNLSFSEIMTTSWH